MFINFLMHVLFEASVDTFVATVYEFCIESLYY